MPYTPLFTTADDTREESGFTGNANITDDDHILPAVEQSEAEVISYASFQYVMPFSANANWTGSPAESYIKRLATDLAAGILLTRQYRRMGGEMWEIGKDKMKDARMRLNDLKKGMVTLLDTGNAELARNSIASEAPCGLPNESDYDEDDVNNAPKFTNAQKF